MNLRLLSIALGLFFLSISGLKAQKVRDEILHEMWNAQWITGPVEPGSYPNAYLKAYGVYKFRKAFNLSEKPSAFIVHISADNRYKFFVNGQLVMLGPARGDMYYWNFETVDLAKYLKAGENIVSAVVWNDGPFKPEAQITHQTGFILQGDTPKEEVLNTNQSWKVIKDNSYQPRSVKVTGYYVAGPGEFVDMNKHVFNWHAPELDDSEWANARPIGRGTPKQAAVNATGWLLVPSPIPPMEMTQERLQATRRTEGVEVPKDFPAQIKSFTIPANTQATILLDQSHLTNAYPTLKFSKGKNASITMAYAEALYVGDESVLNRPWIGELPKGNRDEVDGKIFIGKKDSVVSNGKEGQAYTPLWYRTYRYIQLKVSTKSEPLTINDVFGTFTGYPMENNAKFVTDNDELHKMLEIGWRTARLCAHETYMDCPYYEQLQYIGDARIQALVTLYNSGDERLVKQALNLMDHSRVPEGITMSRYPTDLDQRITTFSLWWIAMVHDYYMYGSDVDLVKQLLPGTRQVLNFYDKYQQADGSLKDLPYWLFTDWVRDEGWDFGQAPTGENGESAVLDVQLLLVLQMAAELEKDLGLKELAEQYETKIGQLKQTVKTKYWSKEKNLFADTEKHDFFSQHVNSLAILAEVVNGEQALQVADNMLADESLSQATIYFKYYLHLALTKAGKGNDYLSWLDKWRENIALGLTTWAETSDVSTSRSDSHAWGSSPNIEFYRIILGIDADAPGFSRVRITPHLGELKVVAGEMPHPKGSIAVSYELKNDRLEASIELPEGVEGVFVWSGKEHQLKAGMNSLSL
ncbi:alpha-L-rhamnosidase C-terminal domain-containing protein [Roseivirga pacifica]|uniref:alpha-L-rhamnosidase-related protein n=1 Tax=Roseivirga pacifica TaxID=1267423 RepID=UPI00227BC06D|nr:alpha-L-rhamnosidase C-terminal domain-containing protein [Roseivirga pacifica]